MPSERRGTVTDDVAGYIRRLKGTMEWKGDKAGTIRAPIGKVRVDDIQEYERSLTRGSWLHHR